MFFSEPEGESAEGAPASLYTTVTIGLCAVATLALGVVPGPVLDLAANAGDFIR